MTQYQVNGPLKVSDTEDGQFKEGDVLIVGALTERDIAELLACGTISEIAEAAESFEARTERLEAEAEARKEEAAQALADASAAKIATLAAGTIDSIKGKFKKLSADELALLKAAEEAKGDAARKTLVEAIGAEIAARA